jgi:plasmid maintenance system antidote protein VapI
MTLPPAIARRLIDAAAKELASMLREEVSEAKLLSIQQAADMLGVSKPTARALVGEWIDLGVASPRIELSKVRELIERRRVRS